MNIQKTPVVLAALFAASLLAPSCPQPACANELHRGFPYSEWRHDRHVERRIQRVHEYREPEPYHDGTWIDDRHDEREERGRCIDPVRGVGTQDIRQEAALHAAKKDWMERVRFDHGESFIDLTYAKNFTSSCNRVSIGELAGAVTYRCQIWAQPCHAPLTDKGPSFTIKDREETEKRDEKQ